MTAPNEPNYYAQYDLEPSQVCEWLIRETSETQSHVVMAFGWMSKKPANVSPYHLTVVANQLKQMRALTDILQAHVDRARAETSKVETV
jgi:hypothetical protein